VKNLITSIILTAGIFLLTFNPAWAEDDPQVKKLKSLCEEGNGDACFHIGERYRTIELDNKTATGFFLKGCDGGHITACTHAGILIQMTGKQYSPEWKQAAQLYEKGCDQKSDKACFNLGMLKYKEGRQKAATKYWTLACDLGNAIACQNLQLLK